LEKSAIARTGNRTIEIAYNPLKESLLENALVAHNLGGAEQVGQKYGHMRR
jgi:hypothetical protein